MCGRLNQFCIVRIQAPRFFFVLVFLWLFANPNAVAQNFWQRTNGPNAADLRALAINASGHIFAASYGGGIFLSINNGDNWMAINNGLTNTDVTALAIDSDSGYVFAGTYGGGIFCSKDNGESWTAVNTGLVNLYVNALSIDSTTGYIFAGLNNGVFRSMDYGKNWTALLTSYSFSILAINSDGHVFAGRSSLVYRSIMHGDIGSWIKVSGDFYDNVLALAINYDKHIFWYGAAWNEGRVYVSTNNGNSWTQANNELPVLPYYK